MAKNEISYELPGRYYEEPEDWSVLIRAELATTPSLGVLERVRQGLEAANFQTMIGARGLRACLEVDTQPQVLAVGFETFGTCVDAVDAVNACTEVMVSGGVGVKYGAPVYSLTPDTVYPPVLARV